MSSQVTRWAGSAVLAALPAYVIQGSLPAQTLAPSVWQSGARFNRNASASAADVMRIPLERGRFIRIEVMQAGSDLSVTLSDPGGNSVAEADSDNGRYGPETVAAITETSGDYRLEVKRNDQAGSGDYAVTVLELRDAAATDGEVVAAYRNYMQGMKQVSLGTANARLAAIRLLELSLVFFSRTSDRYMEGLAAMELGVAYERSGEFRTALPWCERAAASFRAAADRHGEADALNNEGGAMSVLGEPMEALKLYRQARLLYASVGDRRQEALILNNIGVTEGQLAHWQQALDNYGEALPLFRALGDRQREGLALHNMGQAYAQLGETEKAVELLGQALAIRSALHDSAEAKTLSALASAWLTRSEPARAMEYLARALPLSRTAGDRRDEGEVLYLQGRAFSALGRLEDSRRALLESLELERAVGDRRFTGEALLYLGTTYLAGEPLKAVDYGAQALTEFHAIGDRRLEAISLETIARAEGTRGNVDAARKRMEEALVVGESARQGADSQQLRTSFFATRQDGYSFYIDLLMRMGGRDALALESSERGRARSLLEMLAAPGTTIPEGVDTKLLERERDISDLLNAKGARLLALSATSPQAAELTREVRDMESEYQDVQAAIRKSSPRYAAVTQPSVWTARQIQENLLDRDTLLLEYALGEERSYLWVVSKDALRSYRLPARAKIEAQAIQVSQLIAARAPARALDAASSELSRMVFGEAGPALGDKRLLIVPDGALQSVPFAMLPEPAAHEPLVVRHEVVMAPSASALVALRTQVAGRKPAAKSLAVFADPVFDASDPRAAAHNLKERSVASAFTPKPETARILEHLNGDSATGGGLRIPRLPYTAQEAERILKIAPDAADLKAIGFDASRETAIGGRLSEYKYLHFATHGYLDTERPELSALVLSQIDRNQQPEDGFLRVDDIYNARLSADLVVLSACQTGLGKEVRGEGLMGLTRAFLYAGVPRVIVSLWNVNDQATSELMAGFYAKLLRRGKRPSEALREAQLELRKQKRWESPYYWAAFVQQGDWQ
jgi:CHAT domain-containing protein